MRRLGPGDEDVLRAVRLAALAADPAAFGSTLAREEAFESADWTRRLGPPAATFVVGSGSGPAQGMAWGVPDADDPTRAHLFGMWVAPAARGTGAAGALVEAVVGWATEAGAERVDLTVVVGNAPAERLYRRHGFRVTDGSERRGGDGQLEVDMTRPLAPPPRGSGIASRCLAP